MHLLAKQSSCNVTARVAACQLRSKGRGATWDLSDATLSLHTVAPGWVQAAAWDVLVHLAFNHLYY